MLRVWGPGLQAALSRHFSKLPIVLLLLAGCVLAAHLMRSSPTAHSLINAESVVALSFLAAIYSRSLNARSLTSASDETRRPQPGYWPFGASILALLALFAITDAAYAKILRAPFVFDDYRHIAEASRSSWWAILRLFRPAEP